MVKTDPRPLYLLVKDKLLELINNDYYEKGSKLPSEFELAKSFGVSRPTLRETLRVLEEENILVRRHGIGTFINDNTQTIKSGIEQLLSVTESIEQLHLTAGTVLVSVSVEEADTKDKEKLAMTCEESVVKVERIRTADSEPVVFCVDKIVKTGNVNYEQFYKVENSLFDFLQDNYKIKITYAVSQIIPVLSNYKLAKALNIPARTPILLLDQIHYTEDNKPVLYSKNYFRADRFSFHVVRKRV